MAKNQSQRPGRDVRGGKGKGAPQQGGPRKQGRGQGKGPRGKDGYPRKQASGDAPRKRPRTEAPRGQRRPEGAGGGSWIEGRRAVAEALEVGMPLRRALVSDGDSSLAGLVRELDAAGVPIERAPKSRLDALSSHGAHQGIAVQAEPFKYAELEDVLERAGEGDALVLLLDHVTDQGNLGAIVRSAEVVGAAGVIIPKARAAGVGVGAFKTSAGAVLHLPIAQVANLASAIQTLQDHGFWVGGSTEHAHDSVWEAPLAGRLCIVMGSEGNGISRLVLDRCDFTCKLPQRGRVESLNVAQAATVMCYEWLRRETEAAAAADVEVAGEVAADAAATSAVDVSDASAQDDSYLTDAAASFDIDWDL